MLFSARTELSAYIMPNYLLATSTHQLVTTAQTLSVCIYAKVVANYLQIFAI